MATDSATTYDPGATFEVQVEDVEYLNVGGVGYLARMYQPVGPGPFPALPMAQTGLVVMSIDFRIAPEHPYPAQVQDANYAIRPNDERYAALELAGAPGDVDVMISDVHPTNVGLGTHAFYTDMGGNDGVVRNYVHLTSTYLSAFRQAGLEVTDCVETLWGPEEVLALPWADERPDLWRSALAGLPMTIVWETTRSAS